MATQFKQTDFAAPTSPRPNIRVAFSAGPAGVAIHDAVGEMPAAVRDATLDELRDRSEAYLANAPVGIAPLPALPRETSARMVELVEGYRTAFWSQAETAGDEVTAAADAVLRFPAATPADVAAKLLVATHHAHPASTKDKQIAVDPTDFECTQAGELMLSTLTDALRVAEDAVQIENPVFDKSYALYAACRVEQDRWAGNRATEDAFGVALDRTDAACDAMLAVPVTDSARAAVKLAAAFDRYDVVNCGLPQPEDMDLLKGVLSTFNQGLAEPIAAQAGDAGFSDQMDWDRNLAAYQSANAAFNELCDAEDAMDEADPAYTQVARRHEAAMNADIAAEKALMATPAPDLTAARIKAETLVATWYNDDRLKLLIDDLKRLEEAAVASEQGPIDPRSTWDAALAVYTAAKTAERAHDETAYHPAYHRQMSEGVAVPEAIEVQAQRLQDHRCAAEDALMGSAAPDAAAFAFKFLIAHADGRDANGWNELLVREALRFAPHFPREAVRP